MKRLLGGGFFAAGLLASGFLSTGVVAGTLTTDTTATTATTPTATTPAQRLIPQGTRIAGVEVGQLPPETAAELVRTAFDQPLRLVFRRTTLEISPKQFGAVALVDRAVDRALRSPPHTAVWLGVTVRHERVRAYVARVARRFDREAVDARLSLRRLRPWISRERYGRRVDRTHAVGAIVRALETHRRSAIALRASRVRPAVARRDYGPIIVIRRESKRLFLYRAMRYVRSFVVATGMNDYPTPIGRFTVVARWKNPWWYPPDSPWAEGKEPVPPGPGNPLGTRWLGLNAPGVGIHGTPDAASLGYSVSHGCIRMRIPEAEWLFEHVEVGTPVFILRA
jgi:lipoprotein-anchoring transpeptidase ErfK/SrfK